MILHTRSTLFGLALLATGVLRAGAQDSVSLVLRYNSADPPGLAVMPTSGAFGDSVRAILQRDLQNSDAFRMVQLVGNDPTVFHPSGGLMNYAMMAQLGAQYVVEPKVLATGIHVVLHSVSDTGVVWTKDFAVSEQALKREWRLRVHTISDAIQQVITKQPGIAATRIAYYRNRRVNIIDSDGHGDGWVALEDDAYTVAWHPSGESLVYTTLGASRILSFDIATGRSTQLVAAMASVNFASPAYAPDGQSIYFAGSGAGNTDIYRAAAPGWSRQQLTSRNGDNVQPSVCQATGSRIAYSSTRSGDNEVYIMNADGTGVEQMQSWKDRSVDLEPEWSPDCTKLVYISEVDGSTRYQIFMRDLIARSVVQLTNEGVNQQPSWAPDGRHIVFASDRTGVQQLHILDLETRVPRQLTRTGGAKLPSWSPRLGGGGSR